MIEPPGLLARLPHELILYQLAFFPDLRCHLAFSYTCRRIHGLYDENLWRRLTILSGLGKPLDVASGRVSWRGVCEAAVAHGRVCRLHDCSEAALSRGRDKGVIAPPSSLVFDHGSIYAQGVELHLSRVFEGLTGDLEDLYSSTIPCRSIARPWRFKDLFQEGKRSSDLLESLALPAAHASDEMVTKLAHHFPAACALATFPAVDRLCLDIGPHMVHVRNKDGVCVWDVVSAMARK
ncbi:hypothetical protein JB92DRAFT_1874651 [Gautieria morchelliformis]|nr:hypothetical protein JB92DRAFT_1874651 [Gautieria morchelliformis]